ncbi:30S ribosomal protein S8 [Collinsella aerofaciens]|nr:30S ribosomal protein S8 [Collinsella aerofaciens]
MVMTDPIADFLTRIRNANQAKHEVLEVPASNIKKGIAEILKREGFVKNVEFIEDDKLGIAILSTSEGLLTDKEARQKNVGGEVIAYVW